MTKLEEILINKWGQKLVSFEEMEQSFHNFSEEEKKIYLTDMANLILQSKPQNIDIGDAIKRAGLKDTYTPCTLLKKNGVKLFSFEKIINLPENEQSKTFKLLLYLFQISYERRYEIEKNDINKWWYWDLSDDKNIDEILVED